MLQRRWLRLTFFLLLFLIAAVSSAWWYLQRQFSPEALTSEIASLVRRATGFQLSIAELRFTWTGDVRLRHICLRNPQMISDRCFVSADVLSLDLSLIPLLRKQVVVRGAHIDAVALNFFTEKKAVTGKADTVIGSWQSPETGAESGASASAGNTQISLQKIRISNGTLAHEVKLLPIPIGNLSFTGELEKKQVHKLMGNIAFPNGSGIAADLSISSENLVRYFKQIGTTRRLPDTDTLSGSLQCQACDLAAIDPRLKEVSGKILLGAVGNSWTISSEASRVTTEGKLKLTLQWAGSVQFDLPTLSLTGGQGKLTEQGLALDYSDLRYDDKEKLRVMFGLVADLAQVSKLTGGTRSLTGHLAMNGRIDKSGLSGGFKIGQLRLANARNLVFTSEGMGGAVSSGIVTFRSESLSLNGQAFQLSANINLNGKVPSLSGRAVFGTLDLDKLFPASEAPVDGTSGDNPPTAVSSLPLRLQLALQIGTLKAGQLELTQVSALLQNEGPAMRIEKIAATVARGQVSGGYSYDLSTQRQTARFTLAKVRAHDLSQALKLKATVFGQIDGRVDAAFKGSDTAQMLKTFTGTVAFTLGRGKIKDSFLQKGILNGPLHKLEEKFSDTEFESASLDATFNSGALNLKKLHFDAGEFNVTMRAEAAAGGMGKATLNFRFRTSFVDNVANPLHMGIEGLREGDFYDLPFACRGDVFTADCYKRNW